MPDVHPGAKLPEQRRSYSRCCTICTVQTDTKIHRHLTVKGLSEKINIILYTILIKDRPSNRLSCQRLHCIRDTYPSFNCLLKRILQFYPCSREKLDSIIHVRVMRRRNYCSSHSANMTYQI